MTFDTIFQGLYIWFLTIFVVAVFLPFERMFPRLKDGPTIAGRPVAIVIIGMTAALAGLFFHLYFQWDLILLLLNLQVINLSHAPVPDWLLIIATLLILDFLYYAFHWLSHRIEPLWRVHAIHHADEHVTALSSLLHHPLEAIAGAMFLLFFSVILGLPILLLIVYGVVFAIHAVFSHADIRLPQTIDGHLRRVIVTPDVHRTHHSTDLREGNSNFGAILTIWDRMFGTYVDRPVTGEAALKMGLPKGNKPARFSAVALLFYPFGRNRR